MLDPLLQRNSLRPRCAPASASTWAHAVVAWLLALSGPALAETIETVFFLGDDLQSATTYFSDRMDEVGDPNYLFDKDFDRNLVLYARPENYSWGETT